MVWLSLLAFSVQPAVITEAELLQQMVDLRRLTRPATYTDAQASSYDRKSVRPGNEDWFANGDYGQYIRTEQNSGRTEYVLADLKGPGVVNRIWSANPMGTIRFYLDGSSTPLIEQGMADLLSGKVPPYRDPFAYTASHGYDLYFPFPYQRSMKITVEPKNEQEAGGLYYHVGYRTYAPDVVMDDSNPAETKRAIDEIGAQLKSGLPGMPERRLFFRSIKPSESYDSGLQKSPGTMTALRFHIPFPLVETIRPMTWEDPNQSHNVLQNLILEMDFDGETTVRAPLGSFFATNPGINPYKSLPLQVDRDGTLTCRWPMPVSRDFRVRVKNVGPVEVPLAVDWEMDSNPGPSNAYHFHAQWDGTRARTRPIRDMHLLDVHGTGQFVGVALHVGNPTRKWWGEGDEKVWVDDENFPSTIGTGTEDYFGYAWSSNERFDRPYHGQVRSDEPYNFGHSSVHRWHIFDSIPFKKHLQFDLEMWHWGDVICTYDWTAYWYAAPGGTGNHALPLAIRLPEHLLPPQPVKGAIEAEKLQFSATGGTTQIQSGFEELSADGQIWWTQPAEHDKLTIHVPVAKAGRYEVIAQCCHAIDYGIHRITFNGKAIAPVDFFIPEGVAWKPLSLGVYDLPAGDVVMEVECLGKRPAAKPGNMFGLDYLLLKPKS